METVTRTYSRSEVEESIRLPVYESPYYTPGFPLQLALRHGMRIGSFDGPATGRYAEPRQNPIVSDTGELAWYTTPFDTGLVTVDSLKSQVLVGFVKANGVGTTHLAAEVDNAFCALTLSSLEDAPIARASRLLLTAGSRVDNTGFRWNGDRTDAASGGRGESPSRIEVVSGRLILKGLEGAHGVMVQPLDGAGKPLGAPIAAARAPNGWAFTVGTLPTTWYTIDVQR